MFNVFVVFMCLCSAYLCSNSSLYFLIQLQCSMQLPMFTTQEYIGWHWSYIGYIAQHLITLYREELHIAKIVEWLVLFQVINYNQVKLWGNWVIFYLLRNAPDNQYPSNRIHEYRLVFLVVLNAGVNKWHFHVIQSLSFDSSVHCSLDKI